MHNYLEKQSDMLALVTKHVICNIQKDKMQHKCFRRFSLPHLILSLQI